MTMILATDLLRILEAVGKLEQKRLAMRHVHFLGSLPASASELALARPPTVWVCFVDAAVFGLLVWLQVQARCRE